jgi:hypothetical protein
MRTACCRTTSNTASISPRTAGLFLALQERRCGARRTFGNNRDFHARPLPEIARDYPFRLAPITATRQENSVYNNSLFRRRFGLGPDSQRCVGKMIALNRVAPLNFLVLRFGVHSQVVDFVPQELAAQQ